MRIGAFVEVTGEEQGSYAVWKKLQEALRAEFPEVKARLLYATPHNLDDLQVEVQTKFRWSE